MQLRQKQAAGIHIAAGDMRVDVDPAGHHDFAGHIVDLIRFSAERLRDDPLAFDEKIADALAAVRRIDDAPAAQAGQHHAASRESDVAISSKVAAALGRSLAPLAARHASACTSRTNSIVS